MIEEILRKVRRFLIYIALLIVAFGVSHMLVYSLDYKPLGYEGIKGNEEFAIIQSYNILGLEEEKITFEPPEGEEWTVELLRSRISQQETSYLFLFTPLLVAIFWGAVDLVRGKTVKRVLVQSFLYVLFPALSLMDHLNDIKDILQNAL